jgi:F-type H+-transporting ATPase subunit gamma
MPSLKEIKSRIASVKNTRKITSAMKMVASSKLRHAQTMIENMLPYEQQLNRIMTCFLASNPDSELTALNGERDVKRVALVVYSSNSSLCGGFNANVIRRMLQEMECYKDLGPENILIYPIGRKVAEKVKKLGLKAQGDYVGLADKPNAHDCAIIADSLMQKFIHGEVDLVQVIYHHFNSAASQVLECERFLPIDLSKVTRNSNRDLSSVKTSAAAQEYLKTKGGIQKDTASNADANTSVSDICNDFIVEPDTETVLRELVPKELRLKIYTALLDSNASEHAARMVAMQTATDNADDLLRGLNLQYNKSRQQAITSELLDIVAGSAQ